MFITDVHNQILKQQDENIYKAVMSTGINVDKEELLRALRYDRQQYEQGFLAGMAAAKPEWIPVGERLPTEEDANEEGVVLVRNIGCPMYEAMDWDQVKMFRSRISHWVSIPEPPKGE